MATMTIPEMHKKLEDMSNFFFTQTQEFTTIIKMHEAKFNATDFSEFQNLLNEIKAYAMEKITYFFNGKLQKKCQIYDSRITKYTEAGDTIENDLSQFRQQLEEATIQMKQQQNRKQILLDKLSSKYCQNMLKKKAFKLLNNYKEERLLAKARDRHMDLIYQKNLLKKSFFPWRTLTYKDGYANTVKRQTEKDINNIHAQYQSIVDILKKKILETEEVIKVKKAAKGQFAYALSKNLLKTISNLSLEVMSLNQMSLKDGEWSEEETAKYMAEVDGVIKQKLVQVREYRKGLLQEGAIQQDTQKQEKKKKHITFA